MNKKLLIILVPVLVVVAAAAGWMAMRGDSATAADARAPGPVYEIETPFVVNLADGAGVPRFLKAALALQLSESSAGEYTAKAGNEPARVKDDAQVRDIIISTLQSRTSGQLATDKGRRGTKREVIRRINADTGLTVLDVYFTEFAIQ